MITWLYILLICYGPILQIIIPKTNFGPGLPDFDIVRLLDIMLILAFSLHIAINRKIKIFFKWFSFVLLYSTVAVLSVSWSNYTYNASTIQFLFDEIAFSLIIIIIAFNLFYDKNNINIYIKNICISSLILSILTIYQLLSGSFVKLLFGGKSIELMRATGVFSNPNEMAIYLVLTIPCILYAIENRIFFPSIPSIGWAIAIFLMSAIICTISRKGIIAGSLAFLIFYFFKKHTLKVLTISSVIVLLLIFFTGIEFVSNRLSVEKLEYDLESKWQLTEAGLKMFATSPAIGIGHEGYRDNYKRYFPNSSKKRRPVHNIFVKVLAEYGLIGFIPFIFIFLYPLLFSIKIYKIDNHLKQKKYFLDLAILCVSSIIPFMLMGWFAGGLYSNKYAFHILYSNIAMFITYSNYFLTKKGEKEN